jgi:hypothetical protein
MYKSRFASLVVVSAVVILGMGAVASTVKAEQPAKAEQRRDNLDIIVLVDESGSLSPFDLFAEKVALEALIANPSLRDRNIRLGVLPFSSGDESPRIVSACSLTLMDKPGQTALFNDCPNKIVRQTEDSRANTDFASAIAEAVKILKTGEEDRIPVLILLTDGQYNPDGDGALSEAEKVALGESTDEAKLGGVSIWSIGFGAPDFSALSEMSKAGAQVDPSCPGQPEARIAEDLGDISNYVRAIIGTVTCTDVPPPSPTPSKYTVHPMMQRLDLQVSLVGEEDPVLRDPKGQIECDGDWEILGPYASCFLQLDGDSSGEWQLSASEGSSVVWFASGQLDVSFQSCEASPEIVVRRSDKASIDWENQDLWPKADLEQFGKDGTKLSSTIIELDQENIQVATVPDAVELKIKLASGVDTVEGLSFGGEASCEITVPPPSTTTTPPTVPSTVAPTTVPPPPPGPPPPSPLPYILLGLLAVGLGVLAVVLYRKKLFPAGTILYQESSVRAGVFIEIDGEIAGKRRVSLEKAAGSTFVTLQEYSKEGEFTLSRNGEFVDVKIRKFIENDEDEKIEFELISEPFGLPIVLPGFTIKVELPEEFDEIEDEE